MKLIKKVLTAGRAAALLAAAGMMFPGCGETITKTEYEEFEVPDYKEGTGGTAVTAENFIKIGDPEYAEEFPLGGEYKLDGDITLPPDGWQPVGSAAEPFSGKLHGSGYTITLTLPDSHLQYTGLFGYMKGAIIDNLKINLANDYGTVLVFDDENTKKDVEGVPAVLDSEDNVYLGILAAYAEDSIISGVTLGAEEGKGLNFRNTTAAPVSAGGILGYGLDIILTNSSSSVNIKAESAGWTGGITGRYWTTTSSGYSLLKGLTIKGNLDIKLTGVDKKLYAGGITGSGYMGDFLDNRCESGTLSVSSTKYCEIYAGGITGYFAVGTYSSDIIRNCEVASNLKLTINTDMDTTATPEGNVQYNVNAGILSGQSNNNGAVISGNPVLTVNANPGTDLGSGSGFGTIYAGGLNGQGVNTNCAITGSPVITINTGSNVQTIMAGGLAGSSGITEAKKTAASGSYITGSPVITVTATDSDMAGTLTEIRVGGIVGDNSGLITGCYITGKAVLTLNADTRGSIKTGGLAAGGWVEKSYIFNKNSPNDAGQQMSVIVNRTYTGGTIGQKWTYVGGLVGEGGGVDGESGAFTDSFSFCNVKIDTHAVHAGTTYPVAIGGLAGKVGSNTESKNSYCKGRVELINECAASSTPAGYFFIGGIGGFAGNASSAKVEYCAALNSLIRLNGNSTNTTTTKTFISRVVPKRATGNTTGITNDIACVDSVVIEGGTEVVIITNTDNYTNCNGADKTQTEITANNGALFSDSIEEGGLGWDFVNTWKWDSALGLPVLR